MCQMSPLWLTLHPGRKQFVLKASAVNAKAWGERGWWRGVQVGARSESTGVIGPPRAAWGLLWVLLGPWALVSAELLVGCDLVHLREREAKKICRQHDFGMTGQSNGLYGGSERKLSLIWVCCLDFPVSVSMGRDCCLIQHDLKLVWLPCFWKAALHISVSPLTASFCVLLFSITVGILQSGITATSTSSCNGPEWWSLWVARKN